MYSYIEENLKEIQAGIARACQASGRSPESVTLVGVTKTYEADVINAAIGYGIDAIGENRVQEITRKYDAVEPGVQWHLIGQLQTNKVKYIIDKVSLIHSLDSVKLADEIQKRALKADKIQEVLIQVNIAGETQKSGVSVEALPALIEHVLACPNIRIKGLMNIAPFVDDPETLRDDFKKMKALFDGLSAYQSENMCPEFLSMGMSSDYEVAISEGANMVRVGTKIFGSRK